MNSNQTSQRNRDTWEHPRCRFGEFSSAPVCQKAQEGSGGQQRRNSHGGTGEAPRVGSKRDCAWEKLMIIAKARTQWTVGHYRNGQTDTFVLAVPVDYKPKVRPRQRGNDNKVTPVKIRRESSAKIASRPMTQVSYETNACEESGVPGDRHRQTTVLARVAYQAGQLHVNSTDKRRTGQTC